VDLSDGLAVVEANYSKEAQRSKAEIDSLMGAYKRLFATPDGQTVMADLRRRFVDVPIARPGQDPQHAFFREGRRSAIAFIYQASEGDSDGRSRTGTDSGVARTRVTGSDS
tara:strand:- start:14590 stop:14922 length:333 start_codon:yes stop_codon:yes gene_type:complete